MRAGDAPLALAAMRGALEGRGIRPQVFFLEARDEILIRRFSETRHRHPLDDQRGIASSIAEERRLLEPIRADADVVIDTTDLSLRELRERLFASLADSARPGPAGDPDHQLRLQVRACRWRPTSSSTSGSCRTRTTSRSCGQLSGLTEEVREFVLGQPITEAFLAFLDEFFDVRDPGVRRRGQDAG